MKCPICRNTGKQIFQGKIMRKYIIQYYQCPICAFVYTEKPYWIAEAYEDSITNVDTGIMMRTVSNVFLTNVLIDRFFDRGALFLDWGGGYGIFTRMMRDLGYNWTWYDKYSNNLVARGFEYNEESNVELISAFELFEHFEKPMEELEKLFSVSKSILFSTLIYDRDQKYRNFEDWWYYVPETGQHISFYSQKTLEYMAEKFNVHYYKINDGIHLFSEQNLDTLKFKVLLGTKLGKIFQNISYWKRRKRGLAVKDMQAILKIRERGK